MNVKTFRGPIDLTLPNGDKMVTEYTVRSYDNWVETPFGPINFGRAHISERMFIERVQMPEPPPSRWSWLAKIWKGR